MLGNKDKALACIDKINVAETENQSRDVKFFSARGEYMKARIYAALGQPEEAIVDLKLAKNIGIWFYPYDWQYDIFLKPLFDHAEFQELVRPK